MIASQEIIERSIYYAILNVTKALGYTLDPNDYLPISPANAARLEADIKALPKYISIFGQGSSSAKDKKITPRIVINARGFYPGEIGLPREIIEKTGNSYLLNLYPTETIDQYIDIHLVSSNQEDNRLLHQILFSSLPSRGYIKPYTSETFLKEGNIFIELNNFFDYSNTTNGLFEKVYEFGVYDTLSRIEEDIPIDIVPITDISVILNKYGYTEELIKISSQNK